MKRANLFFVIFGLFWLAACGSNSDAPAAPQDSAYFLSHDKIIDINGVNVRYREEGPASAQTLVMIHGFTSSLETWDALADNLTADYRVIRLDLPGHGLTGPDPRERYTNEETVIFLERFLSAIEVDAPVLIGNSLGGLAAWRAAAKSPELASKIVLIAPGGFPINGVTEQPADVPMMVKIYLTKAPAAGVKQATSALYSDPSKLTGRRLEQVRDMMLVPGNGDAFVARAAAFTLPDPVESLEKIAQPVLIIWGEKDIMVPAAHADKFHDAMPNSYLKVYPDAGHVPQEEVPEKLAADIRRFLAVQE